MESQRCCASKFESKSRICHPTLFFVLDPCNSSIIPKLNEHCQSWLLLDGIALDVKTWYNTRWTLHRMCRESILVFRSSWVRCAVCVCNELISLNSVTYYILLMTLLNVCATPGIVTTRIRSNADVITGCPCGGVDWISEMLWGTGYCLSNGYNLCSSLIIPGKLCCARLIHSSSVFPHKIDSGNPITTFSVSSLLIIAAATEVKVMPRFTLSTPALLAYHNSEPTSPQWTVWSNPGAPETSFQPGLELNSSGLDHCDLLIRKSDGHSVAWRPH